MSALGNREVMAENLRHYVDRSGKTQKELSEVFGVATSTFNDWMKAKNYPRIDKIEKMAKYFGILKSDLIERRTEDREEMKKKNDAMTDIVLSAKADEELLELLVQVTKLSTDQRAALRSVLAAFGAAGK